MMLSVGDILWRDTLLFSEGSTGSRKPYDDLTIKPLFDGSDFSFDVAKAMLAGVHPPVINRVSDRAYYILKGSASVVVDGRDFTAKAGDLVVIKSGQKHQIRGEVEFLVITSPSFDPANEESAE
ncbi:cupin domain-containing protein [Micromonospora trifolii]|uniref:cupin domain-containing protein n=1 Tax=Micromonospora trifolii TaxID=2911208 RepID=UPI003D2ECE63